jgi:transposase
MKLTDRKIIDIYEFTKKHTMREACEKFDISMSTVARINRRSEKSRYSKVIDKWVGRKY